MVKIVAKFSMVFLMTVALQASRPGLEPLYFAEVEGKSRLFVAPVLSHTFNAESRDLVGMLLVQEMSRFAEYDVLSFGEINAVLGVEKVKDQLGCSDVVCLREIGMALGGADILQAEVKKLKGQAFLKLSIVKPLEVRTTHRALEILSGNFHKWPQGVRRAVGQLLVPNQTRETMVTGFGTEPQSLEELGLGEGTMIKVVADSVCSIEHNGVKSTPEIQPRTSRGTIRFDCVGTSFAFEKVELVYSIGVEGITYQIKSKPWAIVRDRQAIGLGKTPLAPQRTTAPAFFELINPKQKRLLRIGLQLVRG